MRTRHDEGTHAGWCGGGCREGMELLTSDDVGICIHVSIYMSAYLMENLSRNRRVSLNCRKRTPCGNLPC